MYKIALSLACMFTLVQAFAQNDTTVKYYTKTLRETTADSAFYYTKYYRSPAGWHGATFYKRTNKLQSMGSYKEPGTDASDGEWKNYKENGILDYTTFYESGKALERTYYYPNGQKRSWIAYNENGYQQNGWDEKGTSIKGYVVEREARFKGGVQGWIKYLEKNLNAGVAAESGAPEGVYKVKLQFVVSKEGLVSNVKAAEIPARCRACVVEAVRAVASGPEWEPAIQNNEPVVFQAIQYISFVVEEASGKKRGRKVE